MESKHKNISKRTISVIIFATLIFVTLVIQSIDSNAQMNELTWDAAYKTMSFYISPYEGLTVEEAFPLSGGMSDNHMSINLYANLYEKGSNEELSSSYKLIAGKTYHYVAYISKTDSGTSYPGYFEPTFYLSSDRKVADSVTNCTSQNSENGRVLVVECDITVTKKTVLNKGTCYVNFAKEGGSITDKVDRYNWISYFYFDDSKSLCKSIEDGDKKIYQFDIDGDGNYDIDLVYVKTDDDYSGSLSVNKATNLTGEYTYNMSDELIEYRKSKLLYYYDKVVFDFTKSDSGSNSGSKSDKTSDNNSSNNNASNSASSGNNSSGNTNSNNATGTNGSSNNHGGSVTYENEWFNGQWYGVNGDISYTAQGTWKSDGSGWWFADSSGWYPAAEWQKIDGYWYYFNADGYMASNEWRDGYYLSECGALIYDPTASWYNDSNGWYFMDTSGWYPASEWQKINGSWYYFDGSGYMVTSRYIDGYWIGSDGVCK